MDVMERELLAKFGKLDDVGKRAILVYIGRVAGLIDMESDEDRAIFDDFQALSLGSLDIWNEEEDAVWDKE